MSIKTSVHEQFNFPTGLSILPSSSSARVAQAGGSKAALRYAGPAAIAKPGTTPTSNDAPVTGPEVGSQTETVQQDINGYGIAGRIWEAAYDLQTYFDPPSYLVFDPPCSLTSIDTKSKEMPQSNLKKKTTKRNVILELGSGTGAAGLSAAAAMCAVSAPAFQPDGAIDMKTMKRTLDRQPSQSTSADPRSSDTANYYYAGADFNNGVGGDESSRAENELDTHQNDSGSRRETGLDVMILSDLPEVVPLLEVNTSRWRAKNRVPERQLSGTRTTTESVGGYADDGVDVRVRPLPWGDRAAAQRILDEAQELLTSSTKEGDHGITHILCSDLVYFPSLLAPLLRTLLHLTEGKRKATIDAGDESGGTRPCGTANECGVVEVIISCRIRDLAKESPFWVAFGGWFEFEPVLVMDRRRRQPRWERYGVPGETWIFIARRRPAQDVETILSRQHGRGDDDEEDVYANVDIDALSDRELLGLTQSDTFEQLLQLSLLGGGDDESDEDLE